MNRLSTKQTGCPTKAARFFAPKHGVLSARRRQHPPSQTLMTPAPRRPKLRPCRIRQSKSKKCAPDFNHPSKASMRPLSPQNNMLNHALWLSFEEDLSQKDVDDIESRALYLKDVLEEALDTELTEYALSDLDLGLHIYLSYFESVKNTNLSPWLIHDAWLDYHDKKTQLSPKMLGEVEAILSMPREDIPQLLTAFYRCMECHLLIQCEADAVAWLSILDYHAADMIAKIANQKFNKIFREI